MLITSSYDVKIKKHNRILNDTVRIYRDAVAFLIDVCDREWETLGPLKATERYNRLEALVHKTKHRPKTKYDFDTPFYKFPSNLRRAAGAAAIGSYSSYYSNLLNWKEDPKGNPPRLQVHTNKMPALYKGEMIQYENGTHAWIKIYYRRDWVWLDIELGKHDVRYIEKYCWMKERKSPALKKQGKCWYLAFPFQEKAELDGTPILGQVICAVDLGINNNAVCSIMHSDGTVTARKFINTPGEKDHLYAVLGRIKGAQSRGAKGCPVLWKHANDLNSEISKKTAAAIVEFAVSGGAHVIVFEHLDTGGKKKGRKKQRLHLWRKKEIQKIAEHKAHQAGLHISRVCAWNTSRLAFDGSGRTSRGTYMQDGRKRYNYSICVFQNGKIYHCDLNASYNIGARYFIREILKSYPAMDGLRGQAKAPVRAGRDGTAGERKVPTGRGGKPCRSRPASGSAASSWGTGSTRTLSTLVSLSAEIRRMTP